MPSDPRKLDQMRRDKTDEADGTGGGDGSARQHQHDDQGRGDEQCVFLSEASGRILAEPGNIICARQRESRNEAEDDPWPDELHIAPAVLPQRTRTPGNEKPRLALVEQQQRAGYA